MDVDGRRHGVERGSEQRVGVASRRSLGRPFRLLWTAYAVSAYGSGLGLGAFSLIAVLALHAGPTEVSGLAAAGLAVGALVAVPVGPWVEFRAKRLVMVAMDLAALTSSEEAFREAVAMHLRKLAPRWS